MDKGILTRLWAIIALAMFAAAPVLAQDDDAERERRDNQKTKQAQAVSKEVYEKIQEAQELVDAKEYRAALGIIQKLYDPDKLTEYEQSNVLNYMGFIYFSLDNTPKAMETYEKLILIPSLEPSLLKSTTYTLAQLYTVEENYTKALSTIEKWFKLEENPRPDAYILKAQILYQLERFPQMVEPIETAIRVAKEREVEVKEEWYGLLNYAAFQMENYAKVRDIQKILLQTWPRKRYWLSLAGAFTELGQDEKLVYAYDAAYTQGMLEEEGELVTMAQLFLQREVPYKAAQILDKYMSEGVISENEKNFRLLAQAWMLSREDRKAIPALQKAASFAEDGEIDIRLANAYLNIGEYSECSKWARSAIRKGGLRTPGNAQISLGMCLYNLRQYNDARSSFREAGKTASLRRQANQWIAVIDADVERNEQIRLAEQEARRRQEEVEKRREKSTRI